MRDNGSGGDGLSIGDAHMARVTFLLLAISDASGGATGRALGHG